MNSDFYAKLPTLLHFSHLTQERHYQPVPSDWYVIITDIKGSTKAIEDGRYKDVNFVGAMSIVALLNLAKEIEIPFIFGGDGATLLIPPVLYEDAKLTLGSVREIVKENFSFELRVGLIEVKKIYEMNKKILITKQEVSASYTQAIVRGGGLEYADKLVKEHFDEYGLEHMSSEKNYADFTSLECRWQEIATPKEEVLTILVKAYEEECDTTYNELFKKLDEIFGTFSERHPIQEKNLLLSFHPKNLQLEASLHAAFKLFEPFVIFSMMSINFLGAVLMHFKIGEWRNYKKHILQTSDTQKFDDIFRTVIAATTEQELALEKYLQTMHKEGRLNYGIHKSTTSLMTCLVFDRHGKHVHFVDGSNGGYAMAAKAMKNRAKL